MGARHGPDTHYVVPNPSGGWDVKRGGAEHATGHYDTKREAIDQGRRVSRNQEMELRFHNWDACIAQSDSHGRGPNPPKE